MLRSALDILRRSNTILSSEPQPFRTAVGGLSDSISTCDAAPLQRTSFLGAYRSLPDLVLSATSEHTCRHRFIVHNGLGVRSRPGTLQRSPPTVLLPVRRHDHRDSTHDQRPSSVARTSGLDTVGDIRTAAVFLPIHLGDNGQGPLHFRSPRALPRSCSRRLLGSGLLTRPHEWRRHRYIVHLHIWYPSQPT